MQGLLVAYFEICDNLPKAEFCVFVCGYTQLGHCSPLRPIFLIIGNLEPFFPQ